MTHVGSGWTAADGIGSVELTGTTSFTVTSSTTTTNMGWVTHSLTFGATSRSSTIQFESLTSGSCGPVIDLVTVTVI